MEDKERQEMEEFTLEDIIREFSDHPVESAAVELPEEEPAEEPEEEVKPEEAEEEMPQEAEASEGESCENEDADGLDTESAAPELTEDTIVLDEDFLEQFREEIPELTGDTIRLDDEALEQIREETEKVVSDTVRLDTSEILKGVAHNAQRIEDEEAAALDGDTVRLDGEALEKAAEEAAAFAENWEPEYEQPMGEYVPPRPIAFPTRAESREMKRKLVVGPEKKYYELTEKGLGGVQIAMLATFVIVLLSAASTIAYAQGMVGESRLRLLIFGQFMAVLVSALLGSFQLIQGVADLFKGRFTLNTLLVVTFLACCADGVFCLLQERIPCCAAFSLEVLMSLWSDYNRRHAELGQMDVLRKANRLYGVCAKENAYENKKVLLRIPGRVEHFMDNYDRMGAPEKRQNIYSLIALVVSLGVGVIVFAKIMLFFIFLL